MRRSIILVAILLGLALADFEIPLDNPAPLPCNKNNCEGKELVDCLGLNAYAAYADDGCGHSGGHAMFTDFQAARPSGFGESRWDFEVVNGSTTGRLEFHGLTVGSYARLYGSLVGIHQADDQWDLLLELIKLPKTNNGYGSKNELNQACKEGSDALRNTWEYWKIKDNGYAMLVGKAKNVGLTIHLSFDRANMYVAQVGFGGSEKNARFGITGWIAYKNFTYDDALWPADNVNRPRLNFRIPPERMKDGDLNINAHCPCQCITPPPPEPECQNNIVENGEECDGGPCCNKDCTLKNSTSVCRPKNGDCDRAETCDGESPSCPPDSYEPNTTPCQETVGFCDVRIPNTCPGDGPLCRGPPALAVDQGYTPWESFNVISFQDYIGAGGDVEGRLAVKRNMDVSGGFSVGYMTDTTPNGNDVFVPAALVVGHNITQWPDGSIWPDGTGVPNQSYEEGAFVGHDYTNMPDYLLGRLIGTSIVIGDKDAEFEAARAFYVALQSRFAGMTSNTEVSLLYGGLQVKCDNEEDSFYVLNVAGSDLSAITWYNLENCNFQANYLINVLGNGDVTFRGGRFPAIIERVVYNIVGSGRSLNLETEIGGSILAPNNIYNQTNGVTKGLVIVGNVIAIVQSNLPICTKFDPVVISTRTTERITGRGSAKAIEGGEGYLVPVPGPSSFTLGDELKIGSETVELVKGIQDDDGNWYFQVDPPLENDYDAGTPVSSTVQNPLADRPKLSGEKFVAPTEDEGSVASGLNVLVGLIALMLMALLF